jgi:small subunit ribosomal protein S20
VANTAQAKKRIRQARKHQQHNISLRSLTRTHLKKTVKAVAAGDHQAASAAYKAAIPVLDKMVNKGIIHKNKAARHKSRLNKHLKAMALTPVTKPVEKVKSKAKTKVKAAATPDNTTPSAE